jgi:hypothetical protein
MSDESRPETPQPSEMAMLRAEMRAGFQSVAKRFDEVDKRFDGVDERFDGIDRRLDGVDARLAEHDKRFDNVDSRLDGNDQRFVSIETRITEEAAATRRHFDVVAEGIRESFTVVIDKTTATGEKVDRLIASNAVEHAAFLDALTDHEVRITQLEGASGTSKPSTS